MDIFANRSPKKEKLIPFGFTLENGVYKYSTKILDGQFEMRVFLSLSGEKRTEILDSATGEEYTLHLVADASGTFVGAVRAEYERVLKNISEECFENDVFKGDCVKGVIEYVREKYGDELEFLWENFPTDAILRRKDNRKWYALILELSLRKLGLDSDEVVNIMDLRGDPEALLSLVDGKRYFAGYHMNKKHWYTLLLDGSVPLDEICARIDASYSIAAKK